MTDNKHDNGDFIDAHAAARARIPEGVKRSVVHATFSLERTYDASVARVWKALTLPKQRRNGLVRHPKNLKFWKAIWMCGQVGAKG